MQHRRAHPWRLAALALFGACTYAPARPVVRVANHVHRPGTDSIGLAVHAANLRRPTGLAAFPDGGRPRLEREQAIFYLCIVPPTVPAATLRRLAAVPRPDSIRSGFTPWLTRWDQGGRLIGSLRGYTTEETEPGAAWTRWISVSLAGEVASLADAPGAMGAATSLPPACEAAAQSDGRTLLSAPGPVR